jgi:hypothetical protein
MLALGFGICRALCRAAGEWLALRPYSDKSV